MAHHPVDDCNDAPNEHFQDVLEKARLNRRDIIRGGLTVDYKLAAGLTTKVSAQYQDKNASGVSDVWTGFVRLQRDF